MTAEIIDGRKIAAQIRLEVKAKVVELRELGLTPALATILVGEDPASQVYVDNKHKACKEVGIKSEQHLLSTNVTERQLLDLIEELNRNTSIHGILVQLPLPTHINEAKVIEAISPAKDVDGFHPVSLGKLLIGLDGFRPCTPAGIQELLVRSGHSTDGSHVVVLGRSNIVGKPVMNLLIQKADNANASVTVCHSHTKDLPALTRQADILIAAIGQPCFVTSDMVKPGVVIIDVGINKVDDEYASKGYRLVGDVDFENVKEIASAITPVPGGVGPMTVAMLMFNTAKAAQLLV